MSDTFAPYLFSNIVSLDLGEIFDLDNLQANPDDLNHILNSLSYDIELEDDDDLGLCSNKHVQPQELKRHIGNFTTYEL